MVESSGNRVARPRPGAAESAAPHFESAAAYMLPRASDPLAHPRGIVVTLVYGVGLILGYVALRVFASTFAGRDLAARSTNPAE